MSAWQFFFCAACQTERPIEEKARVGKNNLVRCTRCVARKGSVPRRKPRVIEPDYEEAQTIPEGVMDAYRRTEMEADEWR